MQRAPSDAESSIFLGCRRQIRRISITSCRKSFLKLRDWLAADFRPNFGQTLPVGSAWRASRAPAAPVGLRIGPGLLRSRRAALASHSCQAWAITPRAPSADRLCASERREQKTRWHSLKPPGQYGCSAVKSGHPAAWLPSHCPRFMPCTRCAQTNRPLSVRRQCLAFLRQPELSAPVGGGLLACARRAAALQLSCCAPGSSPAYLTAVQAGWAI